MISVTICLQGGENRMPDINRSSFSDAKQIVELFLPDEKIRFVVLEFLANSIIYANRLDNSNWNLNLDKKGHFIRLNTGHEYCIEIFKNYISVLCLKKVLKTITDYQDLDIKYKGHLNNNKIISSKLEDVPDCLVKVPDSVGCHIKYQYVSNYLPKIKDANFSFIEYAIEKTTQLPAMRDAHSDGMIDYLSKFLNRKIPKPIYVMSEEKYIIKREKEEKAAHNLSDSELEEKIAKAPKKPSTTQVISIRYNRDPNIATLVKRKANGICQDCNKPAPFVAKQTGEPFLEIHHIIPLANGGEDTIENTIALCPNCHRKRHYGY